MRQCNGVFTVILTFSDIHTIPTVSYRCFNHPPGGGPIVSLINYEARRRSLSPPLSSPPFPLSFSLSPGIHIVIYLSTRVRVLEGENTRRRRARVHEFTRARGPQCRRWGRDKHAIHASRDNAYRPGSAPLHQEPRRSPRTKWRTHARLVSCTRSTTKTGRERERRTKRRDQKNQEV